MSENQQLIGVFDSGIGGLSVLQHIRALLPHEGLIYVADQANVPYGIKSQEKIQQFSHTITHYLLTRHCKLIVVACNTASAAALTYLRRTFRQTPFVGMEPAVKPGARATKTGKVGVLATAGTFESQRYASLMERFAQNIVLIQDPCAGLVDLIEAGELDSPQTEFLLRTVLTPMLAQDVDTIVLGCTHYPFVRPLIKRIVGEDITIIDPAPAVARQVKRMLQTHTLINEARTNHLELLTTGDPTQFQRQVTDLTTFEKATHITHIHKNKRE